MRWYYRWTWFLWRWWYWNDAVDSPNTINNICLLRVGIRNGEGDRSGDGNRNDGSLNSPMIINIDFSRVGNERDGLVNPSFGINNV